jgi:hypothetical protein
MRRDRRNAHYTADLLIINVFKNQRLFLNEIKIAHTPKPR